ncbi:alpha/beta hydrolase [Actinoplanes sp. NPDC051346]|uniref:alpha/beta hydrolase n=1 Tax=Actinoplanes sp. NPDC051346 TaxID=3155048 RepID=UPI00341369F5
MRKVLAAAATVALVGCGAAAATAATAEPTRGGESYSRLTWGKCDSTTLRARKAECGMLSVPLDHAKPNGKQIKLAVSRIAHTVPADKYQGVMLVNPGGPGGSGLILSVLGDFVPDGAGGAYDWIGFDPRGVGSSEPTLACDGEYTGYDRPPYVPTTGAIESTWRARAKGYAADCARAGDDLLDHLRTVDTVRDMDLLRSALGAEQINYYGFSYGTYLGQIYATLHPQRVRRMVLDGNVNPGRIWYDANLDQDVAFDRNIKIYFGWLAEHDDVFHLGRTAKAVEKRFYREQAKLTERPAGGVIGPDELTDVFLQAGYYVFGWEAVGSAFSAWVNHRDPQELRALFDGSYPQGEGTDNGYAIYLAVQCTDIQWPTSWSKWRADNWRVHRKAPFETWGNAWYNAPCLNWGGKPGTPVAVDGKDAPPILLIGETLDAATPFTGSLEVRKRFPRSALVEGVGGTTHSGSLFGNACVDDTIAEYLKSGKLPRRVKANMSDKRCKPLPPPDPSAAADKHPEAGTSPSRLDLQKLIVTH